MDGNTILSGKPEKLSYEPGSYSRRIEEANRLAYEAEGYQIRVKACKGHYNE